MKDKCLEGQGLMDLPWISVQMSERTNAKQKDLSKVLGVILSVVSQYERKLDCNIYRGKIVIIQNCHWYSKISDQYRVRLSMCGVSQQKICVLKNKHLAMRIIRIAKCLFLPFGEIFRKILLNCYPYCCEQT